MRFRDSTALTLCPLFLRIALGVTFIYHGIPKWQTRTFQGAQAQAVLDVGLGTIVTPSAASSGKPNEKPGTPAADQTGNSTTHNREITSQTPSSTKEQLPSAPSHEPSTVPADKTDSGSGSGHSADSQGAAVPTTVPTTNPTTAATPPAQPTTTSPEQPSAQPETETPQAQPEQTNSAENKTADRKNAAQQPAVPPVNPNLEVKAHGYAAQAIMLKEVNHPYPAIFGFLCMVVEIVGGALILLGLLSRIWGLGLCVNMGYAFTLAVLPAIHAQMAAHPLTGNAISVFYQAFRNTPFQIQMMGWWQMILFVAAWCIFIGGPGPVSIDRLLFRPSSHASARRSLDD